MKEISGKCGECHANKYPRSVREIKCQRKASEVNVGDMPARQKNDTNISGKMSQEITIKQTSRKCTSRNCTSSKCMPGNARETYDVSGLKTSRATAPVVQDRQHAERSPGERERYFVSEVLHLANLLEEKTVIVQKHHR